MAADGSWFHRFVPETKWQSMEWHNAASPVKEEARRISLAGIIIQTVSWDAEGCIQVDFLPTKETVSAVLYIHVLQEMLYVVHKKHLMKRHQSST